MRETRIMVTPCARALGTDEVIELVYRHHAGDWGASAAIDRAAEDSYRRLGAPYTSRFVVAGEPFVICTYPSAGVTLVAHATEAARQPDPICGAIFYN